jgi:hypothetical protein
MLGRIVPHAKMCGLMMKAVYDIDFCNHTGECTSVLGRLIKDHCNLARVQRNFPRNLEERQYGTDVMVDDRRCRACD